MPEGPEIRRMVDAIAEAVEGKRAERMFFAFDRYDPFEAKLAGRRVTAIEARGKAVLVFFEASDDNGWCVYSHNQLYGQWRVAQAGHEPNTNRQLRFAIYAGKRAARLYSASDIRVVAPEALAEIPYLARLGPDPLNRASDRGRLGGQLDDTRFAGRNLGALLLDQRFIAGVGNYLRSEILFYAGLHPAQKPRQLSSGQRQKLIEACLTLIDRAYRLKGITNDPERAARLQQQSQSFGGRRYLVFGRAGQACYDCGTTIEKAEIASRRLYRCPACQPKATG